MRFNIRTKIILTVSLSLVLIFALIIYLLVARNVQQLRTDLNRQSKSFASLSSAPIGNTLLLYQDSGSIRITQQVDKYLDLDPDVTAISVVSVDGKLQYHNKNIPPVKAQQAGAFTPQYVRNSSGYITRVIQPFFEDTGAHRYSIVYDISTHRAQQSIQDVIRLIIYVGVAILLISIASTTWLLNTLFIKPLRAVSRSANLISAGNLDQQIIPKNNDEIGDLAVAVNKMAENLKADITKLQEVDKMKTEFMMIASHNLRTPLTVMRGYLEMADYMKTADELRKVVKNIDESVVRLRLMSEDLLTISSLEAGEDELIRTPTDAKEFITSIADEFKLLASKKKLQWQFTNDIPEKAKLEVNQPNIRSALGNLIDNAIKFTKENGAVHVAASVAGDHLVFTVGDTGIGIASEEIPKLFTKFHRGTSTTKYDYEGVGIGLYLTKLLIEQHGGQIAVKSEAGKGSTFTVYLPLVSPSGPNPKPASAEPSSPPGPGGHHHAP